MQDSQEDQEVRCLRFYCRLPLSLLGFRVGPGNTIKVMLNAWIYNQCIPKQTARNVWIVLKTAVEDGNKRDREKHWCVSEVLDFCCCANIGIYTWQRLKLRNAARDVSSAVILHACVSVTVTTILDSWTGSQVDGIVIVLCSLTCSSYRPRWLKALFKGSGHICDPLWQKGHKVSVWSFWVIDTNRKGNQRALIYHQFQNCAQRQSEVMTSQSKVVLERPFREKWSRKDSHCFSQRRLLQFKIIMF